VITHSVRRSCMFIFVSNRHLPGSECSLTQQRATFLIFTYIPYILIIIKVFSPTDEQLNSLKNNFKFALKLTLKDPLYFGVKHHCQGAHYLSRAKVTIVNIHYVCVCGSGRNQRETDSDQCPTHTYTNKDQIIIYAATPSNELHQCILTHFNNVTLARLR
jgi:hypothetical protein